jgi:hypothetical protein
MNYKAGMSIPILQVVPLHYKASQQWEELT